MISTKVKTLVIVFALLFSICIITVGCKKKSGPGLMNTDSLPGHAVTKYANLKNNRNNNSNIVYLGAENASSDPNFGPRDVNFEFNALR